MPPQDQDPASVTPVSPTPDDVSIPAPQAPEAPVTPDITPDVPQAPVELPTDAPAVPADPYSVTPPSAPDSTATPGAFAPDTLPATPAGMDASPTPNPSPIRSSHR